MKKIALLVFAGMAFSCANYEKVTVVDATPVYSNRKADQKIATIPANTEVEMAGKRDIKKVKYNGQEGFVVKPNHASHTVVTKVVPAP
jgi:hypothetical protein